MVAKEEKVCDYCHLIISLGMKHVTFKKPGTKGLDPKDYLHFHSRTDDDCATKQMRQSNQKRRENEKHLSHLL